MARNRFLLTFALAGCAPQVPTEEGDTTGISSGESEAAATTRTGGEADADADVDVDGEDDVVDDGWDFPHPPEGCTDDDPCLLDILVVIDNSGTMADAQLALVRSLVPLVGALEEHDPTTEKPVDVQMMFTTTDVGNPLCTQFQKPDYTPAMGAPISTGCNERINRFTGLGLDPEVREEDCVDVCPSDVEPSDPFVAFYRDRHHNAPDVPAKDVDGDGIADSPAAQAVACLAPQGIDGCGYESPLEAMLRALDPDAEWNSGDRPFLRPESELMIVVVTDETDCSMDDYSIMTDPTYWAMQPGSGEPAPSSALCWNAGMTCEGPDASGVYSDCVVTDDPLLPVSRYTDLLAALREHDGHEVAMVSITGVPSVTQRNALPPFEPIAGGIAELVVRDWRDGLFPEGDLFAQELKDGVQAADLRFDYGVGPGCALDEADAPAIRALPNPRVHEVCGALDVDTDVRCCIESACDATMRLDCIQGWISAR